MRNLLFLAMSGVMLSMAFQAMAQIPGKWKNHDTRRPERPAVIPALPGTPDHPGKAPSDALVLFDGKDLSQWVDEKGQPSKWIVRDGYMECVKGSGFIYSKEKFGSCQLHVEFATPAKVEGEGQGRGNSGVFLMNLYEVQVLDSYNNKTYSDGQCAAIYGQYPPLVNASLAPGQWQTYDIVFHRPRFDDRGNLAAKAAITVFHNQVLVQDHVELLGPTTWMARPGYSPHADKLPLGLQDHGNPVRYRNIWIRELADDGEIPGDAYTQAPDKVIELKPEVLERYAGAYQFPSGGTHTIIKEDAKLYLSMYKGQKAEIRPESETRFNAVILDVVLDFTLNRRGQVESMTVRHSGSVSTAKKNF